MSIYDIYDQVHEAYIHSKKNNFWDAWGIVASPSTIYKLRAECLENISLHNTEQGALEKIFGLVVIPHNLVESDKVYIVDEKLGRTILGQMERKYK